MSIVFGMARLTTRREATFLFRSLALILHLIVGAVASPP